MNNLITQYPDITQVMDQIHKDKKRIGFKPDHDGNQWSRMSQNSRTETKIIEFTNTDINIEQNDEQIDEQINEQMSLGDRMKSYECVDNIPPYQSFIIRADGKSFSKFTSILPKPFDDGFQRAIVRTANGVMNHFNARTVFCCSDEISLIFPAICSMEEYELLVLSNDKNLPTHVFSGRRSKLESLVSAKCSVLFNKYMLDELNTHKDNYKCNAIQKIIDCDAIFDARLIAIPMGKDFEIVNNLIWRSCYDCYRNTISTYGRYVLGQKKCNNKNGQEMIQMMEESGFDFSMIVPISYKFGVFGKKILVRTESILPSGKAIEVVRSKNYNFCSNILSRQRDDNSDHTLVNHDKYLDILLSKTFIDNMIDTVPYDLHVCDLIQ
jgi:tRNA(His) guanylyltransferase